MSRIVRELVPFFPAVVPRTKKPKVSATWIVALWRRIFAPVQPNEESTDRAIAPLMLPTQANISLTIRPYQTFTHSLL